MSQPYVILVHGAWHQPWRWHLVKTLLEDAGYNVSTPALPSCNDGVNPPSDPLAADVAVIKNAIEEAARTGKVLPVFHSYAGIPGCDSIAAASEPARSSVVRVVMLAAWVCERGTSLRTSTNGAAAPWTEMVGSHTFVPEPIPVFYNDTPADLAREAAAHVVATTAAAFATPTEHAGWELVPATYVNCTKDNSMKPERVQAKQAGMMRGETPPEGWTVASLESDHSPFLSKPAECAKLIRELAGEVFE